MDAERKQQTDQLLRTDAGYGVTARFYDLLYDVEQSRVDGPFYDELAAGQAGPVLDLGCGTGRITLRLARAGKQVTAVDLAPAMLDILAGKLHQEPAGVRRRVTVATGDMTDFGFDERFGLIVAPFRSFQHILEPALQRRCLSLIAAHLLPAGRFVFNAFNPNLQYIVTAQDHCAIWRQANEAADPATGEIIRRYYQLRPDQHRQIHDLSWKYEVYDRFGKLTGTFIERMQLRWIYRWEAEYLLELSNLEIVEAYGGFDKRPLDDQAVDLVFVCKRRS